MKKYSDEIDELSFRQSEEIDPIWLEDKLKLECLWVDVIGYNALLADELTYAEALAVGRDFASATGVSPEIERFSVVQVFTEYPKGTLVDWEPILDPKRHWAVTAADVSNYSTRQWELMTEWVKKNPLKIRKGNLPDDYFDYYEIDSECARRDQEIYEQQEADFRNVMQKHFPEQ